MPRPKIPSTDSGGFEYLKKVDYPNNSLVWAMGPKSNKAAVVYQYIQQSYKDTNNTYTHNIEQAQLQL